MTNQFFGSLILRLKRFDWIVFLLFCSLMAAGLVALYSLTFAVPELYLKFERQFWYACLAALLVFLTSCLNYRSLFGFSLFAYLGTLTILVLVLFFGESIRGSRGWFSLGDLHVQPVEIAKIALILILARFFSSRSGSQCSWRDIGLSGLILGLMAALVMRQPDFGSAALLIALWFAFICLCASPKKILIIVALLIISVVLAWFLFFQDYQRARIISVIFPSSDPLGTSYNLSQSLLAIGSGGIFGQGVGKGAISTLHFLPETETDFIFAVFGETFGFVGITLLLCLLLGFIFSLFRRGKSFGEPFGALIVLGFICLFCIEAFLNIGMNFGISPIVGIGLPFISYGGSSLFAHALGLGIVESIVSRHPQG